ncbi:hypothetical protein H6F77_05380 [Microcoleus sp. FACHB-831]|uniref:hypothetical protein n=1 Tax=Microcoleus sp. FACHB-831 TaxID=2692827 RepID=UPI001683C05C|nr:hypothetical protein [Microcoleus sp. FACHB-831]MBD1920519.1 hypothetical protein [Microcoleus sp. FACHB-831]
MVAVDSRWVYPDVAIALPLCTVASRLKQRRSHTLQQARSCSTQNRCCTKRSPPVPNKKGGQDARPTKCFELYYLKEEVQT